jgi:uncharacterized protein YjbJ (UPF0337 family)
MTVEHDRTDWTTVRTEAQARWTKLTDADLDQVNGEATKLVDLVQARYGYSRPSVEAEVNHFLQDIARRALASAE